MRSKYNAVKVKEDGYTFDSKQEHKRYGELKLLRAIGEIRYLEVHPKYKIEVEGQLICNYIGDFAYDKVILRYEIPWGKVETEFILEDVKAIPLPAYRLKKKLMKAVHNIEITEINVLKRKKRDDNAKIEANSIRRKNSAARSNK